MVRRDGWVAVAVGGVGVGVKAGATAVTVWASSWHSMLHLKVGGLFEAGLQWDARLQWEVRA